MIKQFIISNIDAVITTAFGAFITLSTIRKRKELLNSSNKLARSLPTLAPIVLIFGLIQFFLPHNTPAQATSWRIIHTDDRVAKVEFPTNPERSEATDRAGEIEVHRISHIANLEAGMLNFRLSFNEYPPSSGALSDNERITGIKDYFSDGGFKIIECAQLQDGLWSLIVAQPDNKSRISMRIGFRPNGIYRALATSMNGHHNDPRIEHFLKTFAVSKYSAEQAAPRNR
jgi:hypothetical protein